MAVDLAGKVIDSDGDPKASLTVDLWEAATWETYKDGGSGARTATATTDADGLWAFTGQDITKTWLVAVLDGTGKHFLIDSRNSIQLTKADFITDINTNTINEHTSGSGVTIDGLIIKDSMVLDTALKAGRDSDNLIDFATTDNKIIFRVEGVNEVELVQNALSPVTSDGVALGTTSLMWSDLFVASGGVLNFNNGDVTVTHSSNTLTVAGGTLAAAAITGTTIDATTDFTIGDTVVTDGVITDSTGLQLAANLDINGTADISGDLTLSGGADGALQFTNAGENSIKIPDNQASALIIEEADNAYITFVTTNGSEAITVAKATTFSSTIAAATGSTIGNLTLANGSITDSGGALDFGNETLTTTGVITGGTVEATTDTAAGDNSAMGYTSAEGLILTGQGSTSDVTIKNDADATVLSILTGTTNVTLANSLFLAEQAEADADVAGEGQIWVDTATPNVLMFTNDAGTDFTVAHNATSALSSLVTVSALNSGSITSGFGTIDTGSSAITTTGLISGGSLDIDNVLINGTTIGHTDDTDLMTVADGVLTMAGEIDMNTNKLDNVGDASNEFSQHLLTVTNAYSGGNQKIRVKNTSTDSGSEATLVIAVGTGASGESHPKIQFEGAGTNWWVGADITNSGAFVIAPTTGFGSGDALRIASNTNVTLNTTVGENSYDYVCGECGRAGVDPFECCGTVAWHDDVLALRRMSRQEDGAVAHLAKLGVLEQTIEENGVWTGINMQKATHYTWSGLWQLYDRQEKQYAELDRRLQAVGG